MVREAITEEKQLICGHCPYGEGTPPTRGVLFYKQKDYKVMWSQWRRRSSTVHFSKEQLMWPVPLRARGARPGLAFVVLTVKPKLNKTAPTLAVTIYSSDTILASISIKK